MRVELRWFAWRLGAVRRREVEKVREVLCRRSEVGWLHGGVGLWGKLS